MKNESKSIPTELVGLLEKAESGGRELDVAICCRLHDGPEWAADTYYPVDDGRYGLYSNGKGGPGLTAPVYTTSLDAALALAERVLPGWMRGVDELNSGRWDAGLFDRASLAHVQANAASAPLALCAAILKGIRAPQNTTSSD